MWHLTLCTAARSFCSLKHNARMHGNVHDEAEEGWPCCKQGRKPERGLGYKARTHRSTETEGEHISKAHKDGGPNACQHGSTGSLICMNGLLQKVRRGIKTSQAPARCEKSQKKCVKAIRNAGPWIALQLAACIIDVAGR